MNYFITLEGGEGAGKSTQSRLLGERIGNCLLTREPGGTKAAEWIRSFILAGKAKAWGDEAEAVLFAVARYSHMRDRIIPALQNHHVICDRFVDSTRVYQNIDRHILDNLEKAAVSKIMPHLTLIIDVPADIGLQRASARSTHKDRFESETIEFHQLLRLRFLQIAKNNPQRCVVIDGTMPQYAVHEAIWSAVNKRLSL